MTRPLADLPHPTARVVEQAGGLWVLSREWFLKLRNIADRTPVTGSVTFAAATTAAVTFDTPELSTDYNIHIAAPEQRTLWITGKTTTGFTLNVSSSSSATYGWTLTRR